MLTTTEHADGEVLLTATPEMLGTPLPRSPSPIYIQDELSPGVQAAIADANRKMNVPLNAKASKVVELVNHVEDRYIDVTNSKENAAVQQFSANNSGGIQAVEANLRDFERSSKELVKILDEIVNLHPFIRAAVLPFKVVIFLELKRRGNDKKVLALKMEMMDMMSSLLGLRQVKNPRLSFDDGTTLQSRMEQLMLDIAKTITECGNACDAYMKLNVVVRSVKSIIWEGRLAQYADMFDAHKKAIESMLAWHNAYVIDHAAADLSFIRQDLKDVNKKLNMLALFHLLDTPAEKEIKQRFPCTETGWRTLIEDDGLLQSLVTISQKRDFSALGAVTGLAVRRSQSMAVDPQLISNVRQQLLEDFETSLTKNMKLFERKLQVQREQIVEDVSVVVHDEGNRIVHAVSSGLHDDLLDPILRDLWKIMGWKIHIEARTLVLALRDYFRHESSGGEARLTKLSDEDRWTLPYIQSAYINPISEALVNGRPGSETVSVMEANAFTNSRPSDWSLPHKLAYWAVGWHANAYTFSNRIKFVIHKMHVSLKDVMPLNTAIINQYLDSWALSQVESLCQSIQPCRDTILRDHSLLERFYSFDESREKEMQNNLQSVGYQIDDSGTLALVAGTGPIEHYILPLLHFLLKRHLKVIEVASTKVIGNYTMYGLQYSLDQVIQCVFNRIDDLLAYKPPSMAGSIYFSHIAFGMFRLLFDESTRELPDGSSSVGSSPVIDDEDNEKFHDLELQDASFNEEGVIDRAAYEFQGPRTLCEDVSSTDETSAQRMKGTWSGHYFYSNRCYWSEGEEGEDTDGLMEIVISEVGEEGGIYGEGIDPLGIYTIRGRIITDPSSSTSSIEFQKGYTEENEKIVWTYRGTVDIMDGSMSGRWGDDSWGGPFQLQRIAADFLHFGVHMLDGDGNLEQDPVQRARGRWKFAMCSVLDRVCRSRWSWTYFKSRRNTRIQFLNLYKRRELSRLWTYPKGPFDFTHEGPLLNYLEKTLPPADIRFYRSRAQADLRHVVVHSNILCSACGVTIIGSRTICLECIVASHKCQINFCCGCLDAPINRTSSHLETHLLVKVRTVTHNRDLSTLSQRAKGAAARANNIVKTRASQTEAAALACLHCSDPIFGSCWHCIFCGDEEGVFICNRCDADELSCWPTESSHNSSHPLVRFQGFQSGATVDVNERITMLEKALEVLNGKVVDMAQTMADHQRNLDERFAGLEKLILEALAKR
ncbi:hypothetical protein F5I97DRAFT_1931013 [Phlebopus sp. FC_14]|nr:hypothetical protein F5I97DRAFT_1931013 [Phlebopus sp. FC_14]